MSWFDVPIQPRPGLNSCGSSVWLRNPSQAYAPVPGTGTRVLVDGAPKGKPIAGDDFYRGLLRIWLGDKPVDADLKKGMLGQG